MFAQTTMKQPDTREEYIDWLNDCAPSFISHCKTLDELRTMSDKELMKLYYAVLGIYFIG